MLWMFKMGKNVKHETKPTASRFAEQHLPQGLLFGLMATYVDSPDTCKQYLLLVWQHLVFSYCQTMSGPADHAVEILDPNLEEKRMVRDLS